MNRNVRLVILATLASLTTVASASATVTLDEASATRAGVSTRPVLERSFGTRIQIVGEVVRSPGTTLTVKTPVEARVEKILVAPGSKVRSGEPLLVLHSHAMNELEGGLLAAREHWRLARSRREAGEQLYELEGISHMELEQRVQAAMAAEIDYRRVLHELEDLGFTDADVEALLARKEAEGAVTIRAPQGGVVLEMSVQRFQWTEAFESLLVLGNPAELELQMRIQPSAAARVGPGDEIEFAPAGRPAAKGRAKVLTSIPRVDPTTRTVMLRAAILDSAEQLFPGVFVEGRLTHGSASRALSVPESAVIRIGDSDYVFVRADEPWVFEARAVRLGRFDATRYEVLQGIAANEQVAVSGVFLLKSAWLEQHAGEN